MAVIKQRTDTKRKFEACFQKPAYYYYSNIINYIYIINGSIYFGSVECISYLMLLTPMFFLTTIV